MRWLIVLLCLFGCESIPITYETVAPVIEHVVSNQDISTPLWQRILLWSGIAGVLGLILLGDKKE